MNVLVNENSLQDIADAIREKNGTEATYKPSEMGEAILCLSDELLNYVDCFDFRNYKHEKLNIQSASAKAYNTEIIRNTTLGFLRGNTFIKECIALFPNAKLGRYAFYGCSNIIYIKVDVSNMKDDEQYTAYNNMFCYCEKLETIDALLDGSNCGFSDFTFDYCNNLKNVRFVSLSIKSDISFAHSSLLSDESIQSIIEGLADLTGQATKTITFHTGVKAKLTEEQIATITSKNWTLA